MKQSGIFGIQAEEKAQDYLKNKGYKILARNYRIRGGEIDIVAADKHAIVFVEVKARSNSSFGSPLDAITYTKLKLIQKTAYFFLNQNHLNNHPFRFDAIEVTDEMGIVTVNHVENITM